MVLRCASMRRTGDSYPPPPGGGGTAGGGGGGHGTCVALTSPSLWQGPATSPLRGRISARPASAERRPAIRGERRGRAGGGAERLALGLGGDRGGIGAEGLRRAIGRARAGLVEREIGRGMLGGVLLRAQEDREQRTAEPDRGSAEREGGEAERLGLGLAVRLVGVAMVEIGHGNVL